MKPDVKKIIADIKATKGNRKFCNGLAGTLQDDNYASSICKYVKTVTPERIDLLIEYAEKLEAEVTDMAVQLANAESKCRELAAENAGLKSFGDKLDEMHNDLNGEGTGIQGRAEVACQQAALEAAMEELDTIKTPATDTFLAEVRVQAKADGVQEYADSFRHSASKIRECHGDTIRVRALLHESHNAEEFAAQLRKGAAL